MIRRAFGRAFADDEIEDLYANAWLGTLRALERRHSGLEDEEIRRYVLTAVANHASKELRRRGRRPTSPLDDAARVADGAQGPDERLAGMESSRVTRDVLASLPPRRRAVMLLRYGWGLEPAQVCGLVKGLSPRAYRKEITRGVDEVTEKLRLVRSGGWCADREPVLKAFAAGTADEDQARQARHHLAHCRDCGEFVGRLERALHDVGSSLAIPASAAALVDGRLSPVDWIRGLPERLHGTTAEALSGSSEAGEAAADLAGRGGVRGAGAAGSGVLAKLAGAGSTAKLAALCVGSGLAATACVAAGIATAERELPQKPAVAATTGPAPSEPRAAHDEPAGGVQPLTAAPAPDAPPPADEPAADATDATAEPVAPPAGERQFGLVPAPPAGTSDSSLSKTAGDGPESKGPAIAAQFGP